MIVFKKDWNISDKPALTTIIDGDILFLGNSMDAKLYHRHWVVIGNNTENLTKIELPYYRIGTIPGETYMTDHSGNIIRRCTTSEFEKLQYQSIIAPVRYEKALKAYHNVEQWQEDYKELLIDNHLLGTRLLSNTV